MLSVIVPVYNEQDNVIPLHERLIAALQAGPHDFEIIFVNDGSTDQTKARVAELAAKDQRVKLVDFRRNFGQTAAMMAGIDYSCGDILIPMDGDLQNDPQDIPRLVHELDDGYDVVSGWRKNRKDNALVRNLPSRIANKVISFISGVHLNDYGCSLKAYRREVLKEVKLYGEMHRFIPIYASWLGAKITELPVTHHPRVNGQSKYGLERTFKVILDLMVVKFFANYLTKPIYVFGGFGLANILFAFLVGVYAVYLKAFEGTSFNRTPLPLLFVMTFLIGGVSILAGLLAELIVRTYYESQGKSTYLVKETINVERGISAVKISEAA